MATIQEINSSIIAGDFTNDQLNSIGDAIRFARAQMGRKMKFSLKKGDKVKFTSSKTGMVMQGNVTKIAVKYVTVSTPQGLWRVPANMLEAV